MLNLALRPVLTRWHPALEEWEAASPPGRSRAEHEAAWDRVEELRAALDDARLAMTQYARIMADACGVPDLISATRPEASDQA